MRVVRSSQLTVGELREFGKAIKDDQFFRPFDLTDERIIRELVWDDTTDEFWFIEDGGRLAAMGMIRGWDGDWEEKVIGVIVNPEDRGKRYGSLMLEFLCCLAVNYKLDHLRLHVSNDNEPAKRLYTSHGWIPMGVRDDGEIIMRKYFQ